MEAKGMMTSIILVIVAIVIILSIVGNSASTLSAGAATIYYNSTSYSGLPLASLFSPSGVALLVFMAGILLSVIILAMKRFKK